MELFFRKYGEGNAHSVVILHGLMGTADNWQTAAKTLAEQLGCTVYALDQRNHGHSPWSTEWNYQLMAADLKEFLDKENIHKPILMGHSMGGKTVMFYSSLYPDAFEKLIIVDIAPKYYPIHHQTILDGLNSISLPTLQSRQAAEAVLTKHGLDFSTRQFLLKNLYRTNQQEFKWRMNLEVITQQIENVGEVLIIPSKKTSKPVLFIRGGKSHYILDKDMPDILNYFPTAELVTIEEAGHWVHVEQPKAFLESVVNFIEAGR